MTGSLQSKNDKYYVVLNLYDDNGKRRQKWIATDIPSKKGNKKLAEQFLREKLGEYEAQTGTIICDMKFSDAIRNWLKSVSLRVDAVTLQGYQCIADTQLLPYFDTLGIKLKEVDRRILQKYIEEKYHNGRKDGKGGLSPASLRRHKNILRQTLEEARINGLIASNPCDHITLPAAERMEYQTYNADQLNTLFSAIQDDPLFPLIKTTAIYGLRRSEVLGLKWDSVDFQNDLLTIKHTVSKVTKVVEKDKTKNNASHRSFPLVEEIREIILLLKDAEKRNKKLFGASYHSNEYIFKWDDGTPFSPDYVSQHFSAILKANHFPHIRFHELRHSCASLLINQGFTLKDVQEWLGHADIKMTANIYSHLDVTRKKNIAANLAGCFQGTTKNC